MTVALKTVNREESISRSRFVDCPVCKNHTMKLKRSVQVGRCKSCNETYKVIVVYVKVGRKPKTTTASTTSHAEKAETTPDLSLPSWQLPSDSSLFGTSSESYSGLSDLGLDHEHSGTDTGTGSSSGQ